MSKCFRSNCNKSCPQIYLAVGCAQDVVDAGHDGGDVGDVATVIHGSCKDNGIKISKNVFKSFEEILTVSLVSYKQRK